MSARIIGPVIFIFALLYICVLYLESVSIFFPSSELKRTPEDIGLEYESIVTGPLFEYAHGWYIKAPGAVNTVLMFHGNKGNISDCLEKISILTSLGFNVCIIDYTGYGSSPGKPSEKKLYKNALCAYEYLIEKRSVPEENIIIYGISLGGAVAVDLASKVEAGALILENTFSSMRDMAHYYYPYIPSFMVSDRFNSYKIIEEIKMPKLFFATKEDKVVPYKLTEKLYDKAPGVKRMVTLEGDHNGAWMNSLVDYMDAIQKFLSDCASEGDNVKDTDSAI